MNPVCSKPKSRAQFTVAIEEEMRRTWRRLKGGGMAMPSERDREAWVIPRMLEKSIGNYAISWLLKIACNICLFIYMNIVLYMYNN